MPEPMVPLGEIVATHGLDGWLRLHPFNPATALPAKVREVVLEKDGERAAFALENSKPHKRQLLIKLQALDGIDAAERWLGATLSIAEADLDTLASGEYYLYQTIGFEVLDRSGRRIGVIARTWSTGAATLYVVEGPDGEHLIPAVKEIVEQIDFTSRRMIINPPEGLLDL